MITGSPIRPRHWRWRTILCWIVGHRRGRYSTWDWQDGFVFKVRLIRCERCGSSRVISRERR